MTDKGSPPWVTWVCGAAVGLVVGMAAVGLVAGAGTRHDPAPPAACAEALAEADHVIAVGAEALDLSIAARDDDLALIQGRISPAAYQAAQDARAERVDNLTVELAESTYIEFKEACSEAE